MSAQDDFRAALLEIMPKVSAKREAEIIAAFEAHANLAAPRAFCPPDSRVPVGVVEGYGLRIEVDANGRAARVSLLSDELPRPGSEIPEIEYWQD